MVVIIFRRVTVRRISPFRFQKLLSFQKSEAKGVGFAIEGLGYTSPSKEQLS